MERDTIIFDLDGTLLNSLGDLHNCFNYAINHFGYPSRSIEDIKSFVGNGIKKAIERALPFSVKDEELNKIVEFFREYYKEHMMSLTYPYDGVIDLLSDLKLKGYKTAIVSNKYNDAVKKLSENYFGNLIDIAVGEGYGVRKKPEVDGVMKVIKELNSSIDRAIFVGDSDVDIITAKNVGIPCISVLWGYRDKDFLISKGGKFFVEKAKDIENFLYLG